MTQEKDDTDDTNKHNEQPQEHTGNTHEHAAKPKHEETNETNDNDGQNNQGNNMTSRTQNKLRTKMNTSLGGGDVLYGGRDGWAWGCTCARVFLGISAKLFKV